MKRGKRKTRSILEELTSYRRKCVRLERTEVQHREKEKELKKKRDELHLLHLLNTAVNRGDSFKKICSTLARQILKLSDCTGAAIYVPCDNDQCLVLQKSHYLKSWLTKIRSIKGLSIPTDIRIQLKQGSQYRKAVVQKKPLIITSPARIKKLITEFTPARLTRRTVARLWKMMRIQSVALIPLVVQNEVIGLIDISKETSFRQQEIDSFVRIAGQFTIILDQQRAKNVLKESEEKYKHVAEHSVDGIAMAQDYKIIYVNKAYCRIFGYTEKELIGKSLLFIVAPEDKETIQKRAERVMARKKVAQHFVFQSRKKDGTRLWIEISASHVFSYRGKPTIHAILRDVTERVRMEQALQESEERFREFMNSATDGFLLIDERMNIIAANDYMIEHFNKSREDTLGTNIIDISFDTWESGRYFEYLKVIETGISYSTDVISPPELGSRHLAIKAFKVGKGLGMIIRDMTEQVRVEEELRVANERLQYLLSSTSAAVYTAKPWGDYGATFISDTVRELFGYEPRQFTEDSGFWIDHVHPDDLAGALAEIRKIYKEKLHTYEYRFRCKNGAYIWVRDRMKIVYDDHGKPYEIIGYLVDITEEKKHKTGT